MSRYNVVFRLTASAGAHAGIITWTSFSSKEDFDAKMKETPLPHHEVLAEGVSEEEAIELTRTTPLKYRIAAAIAESTDPNTGEQNEEILRFKMQNIMFVG